MESQRNYSTQTINQVVGQTFDSEMRPQTQAPEGGRNGVFLRNFGKFERKGSTFHWKIFRPGREKLIGYSRPRDMAEKANKQELILDIVRRLSKSYLQDGMRIEMYRAYHEEDDSQSVKLFTLYPNRFIPETCILTETWLIQFLKNHYSPPVSYYNPEAGLFPTGELSEPPAHTALIPNPEKQPKSRNPFDPARSFKSADHLMSHINKLLSEGHDREKVVAYYQDKVRPFQPNPS